METPIINRRTYHKKIENFAFVEKSENVKILSSKSSSGRKGKNLQTQNYIEKLTNQSIQFSGISRNGPKQSLILDSNLSMFNSKQSIGKNTQIPFGATSTFDGHLKNREYRT